MDWQLLAIIAIILAAVAFLVVRFVRRRRRSSPCESCPLNPEECCQTPEQDDV